MKSAVYLCSMGMTEEEIELAGKISGVLKDKAKEAGKEVDVIIHDVEVHGEVDPEIAILFGNVMGVDISNCTSYGAPRLSSMLTNDAATMAIKVMVMRYIEEIIDMLPAEEDEVQTYVETPEGITVGGIGAMIEITPEEAEHLRKIRDILGGGKMVIQKGDLRIEVE